MTPYVARWSEERILEYFWFMAGAGADRVMLMRQLAAVAVQRPREWSAADVRLESEAVSRKRPTQCFGCHTGDRRLYWHHILAVTHGGSNHIRNQVAICLRCHATVHPWLNADEPNQARGRRWVDVRHLAKTLVKVA